MVKYINNTTKQAKHFINAYNHSRIYSIYEAYKKPSVLKVNIWRDIEAMAEQDDGTIPCIIGHSPNFFTVCYLIWRDNKVLYKVITPRHIYYIAKENNEQ